MNHTKSLKEDVLVRHENIWPIIWSTDKWRYFFSESIETQNEIRRVLFWLKWGNSLNEIDISPKLAKELDELWFNWKVREIIPEETDKLLYAPLEIYFDYTYECNLRCTYCYNKRFLWKKTMKKEEVWNVFQEMYKLWIMRVHLAWGEPMIDEEWFRNYLEQANKYWIIVSMATNWTMLTDKNIQTIIDNKLFSVTFSLDWYNADVNDKLRWRGTFSKTMNWIRKLMSARDKAWINMEIDIKPVFSIYTDNKELEELVLLAIDLGIDKIKFYNPERSLNHEQWYYWLRKEEYYKKLKFLEELQSKYKSKIKIPVANNPVISECKVWLPWLNWCIWWQELLAINPDGKVTPCLMDKYDFWNIHEDNWIDWILKNSEKLENYLDKIASPECEECEVKSTCRGWCQVRKIVEYWDIQGIDPLCPIDMKENIKKYSRHTDRILKPVEVTHSL